MSQSLISIQSDFRPNPYDGFRPKVFERHDANPALSQIEVYVEVIGGGEVLADELLAAFPLNDHGLALLAQFNPLLHALCMLADTGGSIGILQLLVSRFANVMQKYRVEIPDGYDRAGILDKIARVGHALGADAKATELAASVDADLAKTAAIVAGVKTHKRVLFVLSFQGGKLMGAGEGTAANGILALAGADNAVGGFHGYKQLTDEAIVVAKPDVILMMDRGGDHGEGDADLLAHPAIASTPAGQAKALVRMDGAYLLGFGPRTAAAARDLAAKLYGDAILQN